MIKNIRKGEQITPALLGQYDQLRTLLNILVDSDQYRAACKNPDSLAQIKAKYEEILTPLEEKVSQRLIGNKKIKELAETETPDLICDACYTHNLVDESDVANFSGCTHIFCMECAMKNFTRNRGNRCPVCDKLALTWIRRSQLLRVWTFINDNVKDEKKN
ncbi:uncharacterized protein LOC108677860 [Hyalella azteca]|uniref:Uncharacterized protein LOC108677860 n=1 Tax=Hyalella azteca TaxID=294128 RepID=A0A8B7P671_HYAAZ|nr:uncharacterized protein LOC108677860 [Hyalella azteca]